MPTFRLTPELLSAHAGSSEVVCLDARAIGRLHPLYRRRPGPELNAALAPSSFPGSSIESRASDTPVFVVRIRGILEQRATKHECGHSDGHDTVAARLMAALETGDVLLVIDSPGGAHAGLQAAVDLVRAAKREHSRHVIGFADEMIGSAAYWWAASVCDEIYAPESAIVGSIGARAGHQSEARKLNKEGIDTTYFVWPDAGKVAFAPELPLSEIGRQRGERDATMAGEAFASAVVRGRKHAGLTRDKIVKLGADALPATLALKAGLIDGIASFAEVSEYAARLAAEGSMGKLKSKVSAAMAEDEDNDKGKAPPDGDAPDSDAEGDVPETDDSACAECGAENDDDAKYCKECGAPIEQDGEVEDESEDPSDDDDDDDDGGDVVPPKDNRSHSVKSVTATAVGSVAEIVGLKANASAPAIKSAVLAYVSLGRAVMKATSTPSPDRALGALSSLVDDAAASRKAIEENKALRKQSSFQKRMDLLRSLSAANIPGYTRGELFVDKVVKVNGQERTVVKPSDLYASIKLPVLRGLVEAKLQSTAKRSAVRSNPFEPNEKAAQAISDPASDSETVQRISQRNNISSERVASTLSALAASGAISTNGVSR